MLKRATARSKANVTKTTTKTTAAAAASSSSLLFPSTDPSSSSSSSNATSTSTPAAAAAASSSIDIPPPEDEDIIERIRLRIPNAHVFKLPPKPTSGGWRGGDWRDKVWQGTLKVVERGDDTAVLLVDASEERNIFAVCPIRHNISVHDAVASCSNNNTNANTNAGNGVDRCIDSSRYFVLRIQNAEGRHMYIGLAFNERNDAFDFNTALEDSRREKEVERKLALGINMFGGSGGGATSYKAVDYTMKEGEKIHVSIPKIGGRGSDDGKSSPTNEEEMRGGDGKNGDSHWQQQHPRHLSSAVTSTTSAATRRRDAKKSPTTATTSFSSSLPWSSSSSKKGGGGALKPSSKDTPSRLV